MRLIIGALAVWAIWAGVRMDKRRQHRSERAAEEVDRWESEGGAAPSV